MGIVVRAANIYKYMVPVKSSLTVLIGVALGASLLASLL
jgi:hypothetical protein